MVPSVRNTQLFAAVSSTQSLVAAATAIWIGANAAQQPSLCVEVIEEHYGVVISPVALQQFFVKTAELIAGLVVKHKALSSILPYDWSALAFQNLLLEDVPTQLLAKVSLVKDEVSFRSLVAELCATSPSVKLQKSIIDILTKATAAISSSDVVCFCSKAP